MSKSEYERLTDYFPDAVKVISEQVLDEAITGVKAEYKIRFADYRQVQDVACSESIIIKVLENLKNK